MASPNKPIIRRWHCSPLHLPTGGTPLRSWKVRRGNHSYVVVGDPDHEAEGYFASYKNALTPQIPPRFIGDREVGFPNLGSAQAACQADLRQLLARLH